MWITFTHPFYIVVILFLYSVFVYDVIANITRHSVVFIRICLMGK